MWELHLRQNDERPFETRSEHDSQIFGTLHANLIGPMTPEAHWSHTKYSLILHDECSSFGFAFNLTHKITLRTIIELDTAIETKFQKQVHTLKTGNGSDFINNELEIYCWDRGITSMTSVPHNPELNGWAERQNRYHIKGACTMLNDSDLGKDLWG